MRSLTPTQEANVAIRQVVAEHRRVKEMVIALGSPTELGRRLSAVAADANRTLWRFRDLYDPTVPLPPGFRFAVDAARDRLASFVRLQRSSALMDALLGVQYPDDPDAADRLPAVCFPFAGFRGGMVLFADDGSLPPYPNWHTTWPATVAGTQIISIRLAMWSRWVRWAAVLPPGGQHPVTAPAGMSARDRLLFDFLASALGPAPTTAQHRFLRRAGGRRWVVATIAELAAATGLTGRQVRAASGRLVSDGLAERLPGRGDGQAWGIRLVAPG